MNCVFGGNVKFIFEPVRNTSLNLEAKGQRGIKEAAEGKPPPNFFQYGFGLTAKQKLFKILTLKTGYVSTSGIMMKG